MNEFDLVVNQELRQNMVERVEVLEQVKEILTLGTTDFVTVELAAQYYEVGLEAIKTITKRHKDELESDGLQTLSGKEIKDILVKFKMNPTNFRGYFEVEGSRFANRSNILIPKRALLRIGMLLRDSGIAKEVRSKLLDIVHDTETKTDIVEEVVDEIRTEQQISEDLMKAILEGDLQKESFLKTELIGLKNKRIVQLENTIVNSLTIKESKAVINKCVRTMSANKYNGMFGKAWNDFYKFANYKLKMNIHARNGEGLNRFNDEEIKELEILAKSWVSAWELKIDYTL